MIPVLISQGPKFLLPNCHVLLHILLKKKTLRTFVKVSVNRQSWNNDVFFYILCLILFDILNRFESFYLSAKFEWEQNTQTFFLQSMNPDWTFSWLNLIHKTSVIRWNHQVKQKHAYRVANLMIINTFIKLNSFNFGFDSIGIMDIN